MTRDFLARHRIAIACSALAATAVFIGIAVHQRNVQGATTAITVDPTCVTANALTAHTGSTLDTFTPTRTSVIYDTANLGLDLVKQAGTFKQTTLGIASADVKVGCAADFDEDGWTDFVSTSDDALSYVRFYKNETYNNPAPANWNDPTQIRTPSFIAGPNIIGVNNPSYTDMGCGDFNGDGHQDFFIVRCTMGDSPCDTTSSVPSMTQMFLGKGNGTFQAPYSFLTTPSNLTAMNWWGTSAFAIYDWNKDGKPDIVTTMANVGGDAQVYVMLNDGGTQPKFDTKIPLLPTTGKLGFSAKIPGIAVGDINGDGNPDLVIGSPDTNILRYYPGVVGATGVAGFGSLQSIVTGPSGTTAFGGAANSVMMADLSGDGKIDLIVATDGYSGLGYPGGMVYYWQNNGTATPFSGGVTYSNQTSASDFDMGWTFDYDHDPDHTIDFVAADGNDSGKYFLFANRTTSTYVTCGTVASGVENIGTLATEDMTVTTVTLTPTGSPASGTNGTITWSASIDGGVTWVPAPACSGSSTTFCATFSTQVGNKISWMANMCSNSTHTLTPIITGVQTSFTYVVAGNHFRSGPIAGGGLIYVGAFREPGDAGHVFAMSDQNGSTIWDAATVLGTMAASARNIFVATSAQTPTLCEGGLTKIGQCRALLATTTLTDPTEGPLLETALGEPGNATMSTTIINWFTGTRFGLTTKQVLGGDIDSTPALLTPPVRPSWYLLATASDQAAILAFNTTYATRPDLLFAGTEDGALHAFYTDPTNSANPLNGREAWAYIPSDIAARLVTDEAVGSITAYPDGSPTLENAKVNGTWRTVIVSGEGPGGHSVYALDVTDTVTVTALDAAISVAPKGTPSVPAGPIPLWTFTDANMGYTVSKPTIIRTKQSGVEKWLAVFASGAGATGTDVGDTVYAIDMDTGLLYWRFDLNDSNCHISTDITAVDSNIDNQQIDGYIDRLFFADNKGRVWKLDPTQVSSKTVTSVNSSINVGLSPKALFSTKSTVNALGAERPIGALNVATDSTGKLVVYFGTGGTDDSPTNVQNGFYAVYADTGTIRNKLDGTNGIAVGVNFYGGVLQQNGQIIFTDGNNLSATGLCSTTAGNIVAVDANTLATQFTDSTTSKIEGPVFASGGEAYAVTLTGTVTTTAYTNNATIVSSGGTGGVGAVQEPSNSNAFAILGWRQVH